MTPIERQLLENQKAIMNRLCGQFEDRRSIIESRIWDCIIKTNELFSKDFNKQQNCCEMSKEDVNGK